MRNYLSTSSFVASLLLSVVGCAYGTSSGSSDSNDNTVDEAQATVVLELAYSESGTLKVVEDDDGILSVFISGDIGVDPEVGGPVGADGSLVETYAALAPEGAEIPPELVELSERYQQQVDAAALSAAALPDDESADVIAQAEQSTEKDVHSDICHNFHMGDYFWKPLECREMNCAGVTGWCKAIGSSKLMRTGRRATAKNTTSVQAYFSLTPYVGPGSNVAPGQWVYSDWAGYTFSQRNPYLQHWDANTTGELGITVHYPATKIVVY